MEAEALDASIDENIPKNLKRAKAQRNLDWDCSSPEWSVNEVQEGEASWRKIYHGGQRKINLFYVL